MPTRFVSIRASHTGYWRKAMMRKYKATKMNNTVKVWIGLVVVAALAGVASGQPKALAPPIETPHVKWAKPYAGGDLKVLFFLYYDYQRGAVEIAQRLGLEHYDIVSHSPSFSTTEGTAVHLGRLLSENDYDVVVSGHHPLWLTGVSASLREKIKGGMGFVYIPAGSTWMRNVPKEQRQVKPIEKWLSPTEWHGGEVPAFCTRGVPYTTLPIGTSNVTGWGMLEKGRVLRVDLSQSNWEYLIPDPQQRGGEDLMLWYPYWEYYFSAMARNIVWASGKETGIEMHIPGEMSLARNSAATLPVVITSREKISARLSWTCRDNFYQQVGTGEIKVRLSAGAKEVKIAIPAGLIHGRHFLDVILNDRDGKVLDWGTAVLSVKAPVWIEKVEPGKDLFEPGEVIRLRVELAGSGAAKSDATYEIHLRDAYDRLVYTGTTASVLVEIPPQDPLSTYHVAEIRLLVGDELLSAFHVPVYVRNTANFFDRFDSSVFVDYHPMHQELFYNRFIRQSMLLDSKVGKAGKAMAWYRLVSAAGMDILPEFAAALHFAPKDIDPAVNEQRLKNVAKYVRATRRYGVPAYSSHEERGASDYGSLESGKIAFRAYLKARYGIVATASEAWGKAYTTWDQFAPISLVDSRKGKNPTPWNDYRDFVDDTWKRLSVTSFAQAVKAEDPKAIGGYNASGGITADGGYNWPDMFRETDFTIEYPSGRHGVKTEVMRSFIPGKILFYLGYQRNRKAIDSEVWHCALHGASGVVNFIPIADHYSYIHPTFAPTKVSNWWMEAVRDLSRGMGKTLMERKRENDGVAILYSHDSLQRLHFDDFGEKPKGRMRGAKLYQTALDRFQDVLEALSLQYDYVDEKGINAGVLKNFRVLCLPMAIALGEETLSTLRTFVEDGGTIISDSEAALYERDLKRRSDDWFSKEVFGVAYAPQEVALSAYKEVKANGGWAGAEFSGQTFATTDGKRAVELQGGSAAAAFADETPALIEKTLGKGRGILLNFVPTVEEQTCRLFEGILRQAGVKFHVKLIGEKGHLKDVECMRYTNGDGTTILALQWKFPSSSPPQRFRVVLDEAFHVYDMRGGTYLGKINEIPLLELEDGQTVVFALLPYEVDAIEVQPKKKNILAGEAAEFEIALKANGDGALDHVVMIEVKGPDQALAHYGQGGGTVMTVGHPTKSLPHYAAVGVMKDGRWTYRLPTALNDAGGEWELQATDVISGKKAVVNFQVR